MPQEKRKYERLEVEALDVFILDHESEGLLICTAKDISQGGVMLEAISILNPLALQPGSRVVVQQCPSCLAHALRGREGAVRWGAGSLLGVEFPGMAEATDAPLARYLEIHGMLPWSIDERAEDE